MQTTLTQTKLTWVLAAMMLAGLTSPQLALAKGCTKGAVVGGVAGHEVGSGHGAAGAAAGCAVGHHEAKKKEKKAQKQDTAHNKKSRQNGNNEAQR